MVLVATKLASLHGFICINNKAYDTDGIITDTMKMLYGKCMRKIRQPSHGFRLLKNIRLCGVGPRVVDNFDFGHPPRVWTPRTSSREVAAIVTVCCSVHYFLVLVDDHYVEATVRAKYPVRPGLFSG